MPDLASMSDEQICAYIASRLRGERIRLGHTQGDLAALAGIPLRTYVRLEANGKGNTVTLVAALRALNRVRAVEVLIAPPLASSSSNGVEAVADRIRQRVRRRRLTVDDKGVSGS